MTVVTFNEKNERDQKIIHDIEEYQKEKSLAIVSTQYAIFVK